MEAARGQKHHISVHTLALQLNIRFIPQCQFCLPKIHQEMRYDSQPPFSLHISNSRSKFTGLDFYYQNGSSTCLWAWACCQTSHFIIMGSRKHSFGTTQHILLLIFISFHDFLGLIFIEFINGILPRNSILLPKLFWPTVRTNCSTDWEKLLKFQAEGQAFSKCLRLLEQFIQAVKGQNNF